MKTKNLDPFRTGWNPGDLATELNAYADAIIQGSSARSNKYHADALQAANKCKEILALARHELERAGTDPLASFRAGWHLREALDLLAKWEYKRGKASNVTARAKRPRKSRRAESSELWQRLSILWETYKKEADRSPSGFTRWLLGNEDILNRNRLELDGDKISLVEDADQYASLETIRKKIKKVSERLSL